VVRSTNGGLLSVQMDADAGHVSFVQSAAAARDSKAEVILSFS
jgi:hypothetical protein